MRVRVVGVGVMGSGIAQVMAVAGHEVVGYDISSEVLDRARHDVELGRFGVRRGVERGKLSSEAAAADLVIEAVPERLDLKITVFRDLDRHCAPHTILASNSSGFPIAALAAATDRPDRVVGWHWASPPPVMKLAEIVRAPSTSDDTINMVVELARSAGKNPIVVKDAPMSWGYVANRIYGSMMREAVRVADEGIASREDIDQIMVDCFGWPIGPFGMTRGATSGWK